jgi:DMSO reductase family type II enzyme chaperone
MSGPDPLRPDEARVTAALARAAVYRVLADAFAYPTAAGLARLSQRARTASAQPTLGAGVRGALTALAEVAAATDAATLGGEYTFLFDRQVRCAPYESAYGTAPQLAGKPALLADLAGFYHAFGLAPGSREAELEDHIAAECEFMSALALKEAWAHGAGAAEGVDVARAASARFLAEHLGRWAPRFADELQAASPLPYYAAAGDLLRLWVAEEAARFGVELERDTRRLPPDPVEAEEAFTCPLAPPEADDAAPPAGLVAPRASPPETDVR